MMIKVNKEDEDISRIQEAEYQAQERCTADLLYVFNNNRMYINEKGYLTKLIDLLNELGYYQVNESLFIRKG